MIWDLGCAYGQNVNYYLRKSEQVLVVDARLDQIEKVRTTFANAISTGRLIAIHGCLTADPGDTVTFYENPKRPWLSRIDLPDEQEAEHLRTPLDQWIPVEMPALHVSDLLDQYGTPHFVKTDLEMAEISILTDLLSQCRPYSVSAELHDRALFDLYAEHYEEVSLFRFWPSRTMTEGRSTYDQPIYERDGSRQVYRFMYASSGPCLDDLDDWTSDISGVEQRVIDTYGPTWERNKQPHRPWIDLHARLPKRR